MEADLEKLSAGHQRKDFVPDPSRGCEKQYKQEEADLFKQLQIILPEETAVNIFAIS